MRTSERTWNRLCYLLTTQNLHLHMHMLRATPSGHGDRPLVHVPRTPRPARTKLTLTITHATHALREIRRRQEM